MLIALEGSSPTTSGANNYKYYVWEAYEKTKQAPTRLYVPGPATISTVGSPVNIRKMANKATAFIKVNSGPIFLIGWSRGAAACIQTALDLKRSKYPKKIEALFLFDAVDQDGSTSDFLNFIPDNVTNAYHAIATDKSWLDRRIFPTCGRTSAPDVNLVAQTFNATHGGIAGAGKTDGGSKEWMWNHLRKYGVI